MLLLCYHKVGSEAEEGRWLNVAPETLRAHVRLFRRRGYGFRTAKDAIRREAVTVQLHFDDAYVSALEAGRGVLDGEGVPGTYWAVPSLVGHSSTWDGERARPLATWEVLRSAREGGHEVGNHTMTHARLSALDPAGQEAEIVRAREALAERGFPTSSACYPYGDHDSRIESVLGRSGIEAGFSLAKRPCRIDDPLWALPRIVVAFSDSPLKLLYKIYVRPHLP